ncbi:MAG: aminotransferase class V-fold PLP-dependent enzyme [Candidatus Aminicenantes bacterium]|nr:aminotransferase class V-fold PLP-dependent enzyme [Candidatus Aminicenantes bacterium]
MKTQYYLDYNATTPVDPRVVERMIPFFSERFHNPSSFYHQAGEVMEELDAARVELARLAGANADELFFCGNGTESDNLAIFGTMLQDKKGHLITSAIEHAAVLNSCRQLQKDGYDLTILPVDGHGFVDPDDLRKAMRKDTRLVSIMWANNEIGSIQPVAELARIAHEHGALFHSDAVQAMGKIPVDVQSADVDFLSLSAHKMYGPKGLGLLFKRRGLHLRPLVFGGGHEKGLRPGTENTAAIVGAGEAARLVSTHMREETERVRLWRDDLQTRIEEKIPDILINGDREPRLPNTLNISIRHIEGESILALLETHGLALSSGSACSSKSLDPSHVLLALGRSHEDAHGSLRISLGRFTRREDLDHLMTHLPSTAERLRMISPFWQNRES